jgi:hypothetical protein
MIPTLATNQKKNCLKKKTSTETYKHKGGKTKGHVYTYSSPGIITFDSGVQDLNSESISVPGPYVRGINKQLVEFCFKMDHYDFIWK